MRPRRKKLPPYAPPKRSGRLYLALAPAHVALLRFFLEAEDHLALPTVVDRFAAVVRLSFAPGQAEEVEAFVAGFRALCPETRIRFRPERASDALPAGHAP